ncbi:MAG: hypothetical protein U0670_08810 [Anaerolineae bacterium]
MMKKLLLGMLIALLLAAFTGTLFTSTAPTQAQDAISTPDPNAAILTEPLATLPSSIKLTGLREVYQQLNRCSTAALTIYLGYYGFTGSYDSVISAVNPNIEDVATRIEELLAFAETQGLRGVIRYGGDVDMLRRLVANGFPVLVENVYYDGVTGTAFGDFLSHNRVIIGYDDALGVLYSFDSLLGNGEDHTGRPIPYQDYDPRWQPFNRDYMVLYRPEQEALVQAVMGDQWDLQTNLEHTLALNQAELEGPNANSYSLFNSAETLTLMGRYAEAADMYDQARGLGLPWRMFWYQYGAFEAYLQVGRYDDVLTLARSVLDTTPGVEEVYYYAGRAYEAQGDTQRAIANYQVALFRNQYFHEAAAALTRVQGLSGS